MLVAKRAVKKEFAYLGPNLPPICQESLFTGLDLGFFY